MLKSDNATGNFTKVPQRIAVRIRIDPGQRLANGCGPACRCRHGSTPRGDRGEARRPARRRRADGMHPPRPARRGPARGRGRAPAGVAHRASPRRAGADRLVARVRRSGPHPPCRARTGAQRRPADRGRPRRGSARGGGAGARALPQVGGTVPETQGQTLSPFGTPSRAIGAQPGISASYDLDLFGRLRQASRAARAQALASEGLRDTVRLATAASVATGYVTLRALDQRLAIARQTLAARADAQRIARRRYETGYSSRLEYRQAQAEYAATAQLVPAAELAISRQENALSLLTGASPGPIPRGLPLDRLVLPAVPGGLPADLLRRRPDLFQAEQTLVAADRSLDSQRAAMCPTCR
ncbi:TolC family protein [Sphingomonas sp. MMS24-JH45]